ncbi:gliding motility-associated ABC transporter permease subunit GldF [Saprospiraceae bacterium]|nr:gliding motility-associated ABC transporter permease subunit GldF [Saprospiraceae bacterium]
MRSIFFKELNTFFSSLTGYISIVIFLLLTGLFLWVFSETSIINYNYASLGQLFTIAPLVFMFLIPAITMSSFSDEKQRGTIELLVTKPLTDWDIVGGKYLAALALAIIAIIPTLVYYYSVVQLGSPKGNIDTGAVTGSYIGLIFLAAIFTSVGIFLSSVTSNQIVAFIITAFVCFLLYFAFGFLSETPLFFGKIDSFVQALGIEFHYDNISKGRIDTRDVFYFISVIALFLWFTIISLDKRKW